MCRLSRDCVITSYSIHYTKLYEAGKIAMACSIVVAGYLGLNPPDFAAGTVAIAFGLAASSIFPALMMGIFSKTMNKQGAVAGMLAGIRNNFV